MNESRIMNILRSPIMTERSTSSYEKFDTMVFKVLPDADKFEIKKAVETVFGVKVASVHTVNVHGKTRRTVHGIGRRSDWKKAYVKLAPGQKAAVENAAVENTAEKGE